MMNSTLRCLEWPGFEAKSNIRLTTSSIPMIPDWQTNLVYFSSLLGEGFPDFWGRMKRVLTQHRVDIGLLQGTKEVWARDYLPVQVKETTFIKFAYQPSYLRGYEHLITTADVFNHLSFLRNCRWSDIRLEGGNIVASNKNVILTEKIFRNNPTWPRKKLREEIQNLLQVDECIFIPPEPGCKIGHADGVVRFIDDSRVLINDYSTVDPDYGNTLFRVLKAHRLHVEVIPYSVEEGLPRNGIGSAIGNHVNFLRIGNLMIVPVYGLRQDEEVLRKMESFLPEVSIAPLPSSELAREGGVLNCACWSVRTIDSGKQNSAKEGQ